MSNFENLQRKLRDNNIDFDEDLWVDNQRVITIPFGESEDGLYLSFSIFFNNNGNVNYIELETD